MGKNKWGDYLGGFLTVTVKGKYPEKIINLALSRGIFLWDVKKATGEMTFRVRSSAYNALGNLAEEHNFQLEVLDKQGMPFYRQVLRRRSMLIWGGLLFIFSLYLLSSFVWFVTVSGNRKVPAEAILRSASRYGLYEGALKRKLSRTAVEKGLLKEMNELSYVEVDIKGVKAEIKVVEKILPGDELNGPCHIVAARDGIIDSLLVLKGQALVKEGDTVSRGDILISGIVFPETGEEEAGASDTKDKPKPHPYMVSARGTIKARVWYEGYGECPLAIRRTVLTGREAEKITIKTPWRRFRLRESPGAFKQAESDRKSYLWKSPWGEFGWETAINREKRIIKVAYSEEEALERAQTRALENLRKKMGAGEKVLDTRMEMLSSPTESIIRVKACSEVVEDIGKPQPIKAGGNTH